VRFADLPARLAGGGATRYKLAGIVVGKKERTSARGNRFAFVQMSDSTGVFEVTLFSEVLSQSRQLLEAGQKLLVTVDVRAEEESLRLTAQRIEALDSVVAHAAAGLKVFLGEFEGLAPLRSLVQRESGGRGRVSVVVRVPPSREVEIALSGGFKISPSVRAAIKSLPGILDVHDI
jgi:DNA polymerase-3 subunit alpha